MEPDNIIYFLDIIPKNKKWEIEDRSIDILLTKLEKKLVKVENRSKRLIKYSSLLLKKGESYNLINENYK